MINEENDYQVFGQEYSVSPKLQNSTNQESKIEVDLKNSNIFTVLNRGDRTIQKAHQNAIIIVGLTRKGKSTTFNWMLGRNLIGYAQAQCEKPYYILQVKNDKDSAVISSGYESVTLAPNVHVDFDKDVSLIDMAGYQGKRNYIGIIGVSYFQKEVFEKVKKVKFIIIIEQKMFEDTSGEGLIKTFQGFINMFNYKQMKKDVRAKLRQSIIVVVTKSTKSYQFFDQLNKFIIKIREPKLQVQNKAQLIEIISWLKTKLNRLQPFHAAVQNIPAQKCSFITALEKNSNDPWEFFDIKAEEEAANNSIIAQTYFDAMSNDQTILFTAAIQSRKKSYQAFSTLVVQFVQQFFKNFQDFIRPENDPQNRSQQLYFYRNMKRPFEKMAAYVNEYNYYEDISQDKKIKIENNSINFIQALRQIQKIFAQVQKVITKPEQSFTQHIGKFKEQFSVFIECFRSFAKTIDQHQLLSKLNYIILRGFKEFTRLYQANMVCIFEASLNIRDYFSSNEQLKESHLLEYKQKIIKNMNTDVMNKLFTNITELDQYEIFFSQYQSNSDKVQDLIYLQQHRGLIQHLKATFYLKQNLKKEAVFCYIRIYNNLDELSARVLQFNHLTDEQNDYYLNKYSMCKIKTVRRIVEILKVLHQKDNVDLINEALQLCLHHKMIEDVKDIYEVIISNQNKPIDQLLVSYDQYAMYCAQWGHLDKGIQLLGKKMKLQDQDFDSYMQTIQLMKHLNNQREQYQKKFTKNLISIGRIPIKNYDYMELFSLLQLKLTEQ